MGESAYINPIDPSNLWGLARTDQGVDYLPLQANVPVKAIGDCVITYSSMASGWPGGAFMAYQLKAGSVAGNYVYVAEHLTGLPAVGQSFSKGDTICFAQPGYPWTEWGWAAAPGTSPSPAVRYSGASDGTAMAGGLAFARFMRYLGAGTLQDPGSGPMTVGGASGPQYTGGGGSAPGAGTPDQTQQNSSSTTSGALQYANNFQAHEAQDPPDPRDNLPFSPQFMEFGQWATGWAVNPGSGAFGGVQNTLIGPLSGTALIRGGIAELYRTPDGTGFRPRGNFKCYFMMNPQSIAVSTQINTDPAAPTPPDTNSPANNDPNSVYLMEQQTVTFSMVFNRMYEVWRGDMHWNAPGGVLPGPSDLGCRWDVRALERLVGLLDAPTNQGTTGAGAAGVGGGAPASLPVQVVFGGMNAYRFTGRIASLDYTYTLFSKDMIPIECTVDIGVVKMYNPTDTSQDLINSVVQLINAQGVPVVPNQVGGYNRANYTDAQAKAQAVAGNPNLLGPLLDNPNLANKLDRGVTIIGKPGVPQ